MYLRSQLEAFADQIQNQEAAAQFRQVMERIQFDVHGLCLGNSLQVFSGTSVDSLRHEFARRHVEFLPPDELERIAKVL